MRLGAVKLDPDSSRGNEGNGKGGARTSALWLWATNKSLGAKGKTTGFCHYSITCMIYGQVSDHLYAFLLQNKGNKGNNRLDLQACCNDSMSPVQEHSVNDSDDILIASMGRPQGEGRGSE